MSRTVSETQKKPIDYVKEGSGYADITLSRSMKISGNDVSVLRMREPTVRDIEAFQDAKDNEATREIATFANLCMVTPDELRTLPMRDYARLQAAFTLFTT